MSSFIELKDKARTSLDVAKVTTLSKSEDFCYSDFRIKINGDLTLFYTDSLEMKNDFEDIKIFERAKEMKGELLRLEHSLNIFN